MASPAGRVRRLGLGTQGRPQRPLLYADAARVRRKRKAGSAERQAPSALRNSTGSAILRPRPPFQTHAGYRPLRPALARFLASESFQNPNASRITPHATRIQHPASSIREGSILPFVVSCRRNCVPFSTFWRRGGSTQIRRARLEARDHSCRLPRLPGKVLLATRSDNPLPPPGNHSNPNRLHRRCRPTRPHRSCCLFTSTEER